MENNTPFKIRRLFYPLWVIGVFYLLYLCNRILLTLLGNLCANLLKLPWKIEAINPSAPRLFFFFYLFYVLTPLLLTLFTAERVVFQRRILPRLFPPSPQAREDLLFGLCLGGSLFALLFLAFVGLGWIRVLQEPVFSFSILGWVALTFLISALFEELFYRGLHLPVLTAHWGLAPGIAFSALLFSLAHINNPHMKFLGLFEILIAGVMFALAYIKTGALHLPLSLHFSWNFFQSFFGFRVSGLAFPSFFQLEVTGPELWTGGTFGPEAGCSGLILLILGTGAILCYGGHTHRQAPPTTHTTAKNRP
jgi:membrane protease YdiL (CAAX protease family)